MKRPLFIFALVLACMLTSVTAATAAEDDNARYHQAFTLYGGSDGNPFDLFYPFELTRPGPVRVIVKVDTGSGPSQHRLRATLLDARVFDPKKTPPDFWDQLYRSVRPAAKTAQAVLEINPLFKVSEKIVGEAASVLKHISKVFTGGKKKPPAYYHGSAGLGPNMINGGIDHAVDHPELAATAGRYLVILQNFSSQTVKGQILIDYPGSAWDVDPEIEQGYEVKADLAVESVSLDASNRVMVVIAGIGKRGVPAVRWNDTAEKAIRLSLKVDGQERKSILLKELDPGMVLSKRGRQTVRYVSDLVLERPAEVTAAIDPDGRLVESNTRNNRKAESLVPGQQRQRHQRGDAGSASQPAALAPAGPAAIVSNPPDLAVTRIWLDAARRVNVEIRNLGGPVPPELWQRSGAEQPYLQITQNGRSWATAPLSAVDPQRLLSRGGSAVVYVLGEPLKAPASVGAVIDAAGRLEDRNRSNNARTENLNPR
ncbi:MAG: hypothetical protein HPY67_01785 [Syntrophaceae bacterium]|nr:hypothetical protein [Syntrophaceae bacterium]